MDIHTAHSFEIEADYDLYARRASGPPRSVMGAGFNIHSLMMNACVAK